MAAVVASTARSAAIRGITGSTARTDSAEAKLRKLTMFSVRFTASDPPAKEARARQADAEEDGGADPHGVLGAAVREANAVDDRADRLPGIEAGRVQGRRGAARGVRQIGHVQLDAAVQQVKSEPEGGKDSDLDRPRKAK